MNERRELHRGRETIQEPNASAARRAQGAAKVVDRFERDALSENRGLERGRLGARIACGLAGLCERLAVGLLDVEHVRRSEAQDGSRVVALGLRLASADDRRQNRDALLALPNEATHRTPAVGGWVKDRLLLTLLRHSER